MSKTSIPDIEQSILMIGCLGVNEQDVLDIKAAYPVYPTSRRINQPVGANLVRSIISQMIDHTDVGTLLDKQSTSKK